MSTMSSTMFKCETCNTTMTGAEPYKTHIEGKKHLKKLKALGITPGSETLTNNQPGVVKHNENKPVKPANESDTSKKPCQPDPVNAAETVCTSTDNSDPVMNAVKANLLGKLPLKRQAYEGRCDICGVEYTSKSHQEQHLSGKKHQKKVQAKEVKDGMNAATFYCGFCNIHTNSVEQMEQHRSGASHNKKVANAKNAQLDTQQDNTPPHSVAKKKFVPSSGTESWDRQIMPPPPVPPCLQPLTYDK